MFTYSLTFKTVPDLQVYQEQLNAINPNIIVINYDQIAETLSFESSTEIYGQELASLDAVTPGATSTQKIVENAITAAINFGNSLVITFAAENVLLGITQAGMTSAVRTATSGVVSALGTGSLYDAMAECRSIPTESKDATFVTDARLLSFINKIETYLGLNLSEAL